MAPTLGNVTKAQWLGRVYEPGQTHDSGRTIDRIEFLRFESALWMRLVDANNAAITMMDKHGNFVNYDEPVQEAAP